MTTVSARIAETLSASVTEIFGVMGNGNAYFLDAASRLGLNFVAVRHEAAGVAAADAYYRVSSRLAAATTTYGAGFSNCLTSLAEAVQADIPVILVTGDAPTTGARPWDIDQIHSAEAVGARTFTVAAGNPGETTMAAIDYALRHRTAAVLAIPYDLAAVETDEPSPTHPLAAPAPLPAPPSLDLDRAAGLLSDAKRPLILAGRGARLADAGTTLQALADRLDALVAGTALAAGMFEDAPGNLGIAGGFASEESAALLGEADVVVVAGARLNQFTMRFGQLLNPGAHVIQIDIAEAPTHPRVDLFLRGDARTVADELLGRLPVNGPAGWRQASADRLTRTGDRDPGTGQADDGRLDPRSLARELDLLLPADRVVVQDGGHFIGWAPTYWTVPGPHALTMVGTAYQSIGLGLASAVGAGAAAPGSTIVLATGDGGLLMALADLESVIRSVASGVIVVFNDAAYGAEVHQYGSLGLAQGPMLIPEVDFASVARGLGGAAAVVETLADLAALRDWLAAGAHGVFLADCRISPAVVAPYMEEVRAAAKRSKALR